MRNYRLYLDDAGLRDILTHEYFGVDLEVIWDIVKNKLPDFKKRISFIQKDKEGM